MAKRVEFDLNNIFENNELNIDSLDTKLNDIFVSDDTEEDGGIEAESIDINAEGQTTKIIPSGCPLVLKAKEDESSLQETAEKYGAAYCNECETMACLKDDTICKYFGGVANASVKCQYKE